MPKPAITSEELRARLIAERGTHPSNIGYYPEWIPIIDQLDRDIAALMPDYTLTQVKDKFGGLRYYCELPGTPEQVDQAYALIRVAEAACYDAIQGSEET